MSIRRKHTFKGKKIMKIQEKKSILARYIETLVSCGHDITPFIYGPLSQWNYDMLIANTIDLLNEHEMEMNERELEYLNGEHSNDDVVEYKEVKLYQSSLKDWNGEKYGLGGCICCNEPMSEDESTHKFVHMNTNGMVMNVRDENDVPSHRESQGCFPIGPSCAKKMNKEFIFKN